MKNLNLLFFFRILIGSLYVFSGTEKLLSPTENFVYIIQSYDIVSSSPIINITAMSFPWMELVLGTFLLLGIWLRVALIGIGSFSAIFIVVVAQAIIRKLEITECGCFGDFVSIAPPVILLLDILILVFTIILLSNLSKISVFSLDNKFNRVFNSKDD